MYSQFPEISLINQAMPVTICACKFNPFPRLFNQAFMFAV